MKKVLKASTLFIPEFFVSVCKINLNSQKIQGNKNIVEKTRTLDRYFTKLKV